MRYMIDKHTKDSELANTISDPIFAEQVVGKNIFVAAVPCLIFNGEVYKICHAFHTVTTEEAAFFSNEYQVKALLKSAVDTDLPLPSSKLVEGKFAITVAEALKFNTSEKLDCLDTFGVEASLRGFEHAEIIINYYHAFQNYICGLTGFLCSRSEESHNSLS